MKGRTRSTTQKGVSSSEDEARHGRWYADACGTAFALELIGERWSLLIVRELMFGGRRFGELRAGLPGISAKVLTERLHGLEADGVVRRRQVAAPGPTQLYELTPWGYAIEPALQALGRWAAASPDHDPTLPLSPASFVMSLRTMFDPARAGGTRLTATLAIGSASFALSIEDRRFLAERGAASAPDFTLRAPGAEPLAAAVYGKVPLAELAGSGVSLLGDPAAAGRFIGCFALPAKASRASSAR